MNHRAARSFWEAFGSLDPETQETARRAFHSLQEDPWHPALRFKRIGKVWSARVGRGHRALAMERPYGLLWFWIGAHDEYERLIG